MKALNAAVLVLKLDPHLRVLQLRQLLINCVDDDQPFDAKYMSKFQKNMFFFHRYIFLRNRDYSSRRQYNYC